MKRAIIPKSTFPPFSSCIIGALGLWLFGIAPYSNTNEDNQTRCRNGAFEKSVGIPAHAIIPSVENDDPPFGSGTAAGDFTRPDLSLSFKIAALSGLKVSLPAMSLAVIEIAPKQGPPDTTLLA